MKSKGIVLACAVFGVAAGALKADVQSRLNVVASALRAAKHVQIQKLAVGGFTDASTGQRPPLADTVEADLRTALAPAKKWVVLGPDDDTSTADALLTGSLERSADGVQVQVVLLGQPEGTVLWQRNTVLDSADVDPKDLPEAAQAQPEPAPAYSAQGGGLAPEGENQVVPTLPWNEQARMGAYDYHVDFSLAYKAFFPTNSTFRGVAGTHQDAVSMGLNFDDYVLWDFDFWSQGISGVGSATELDYAGMNVALVYPFHLRHGLTLYVGPGGRFGDLEVDDPGFNGIDSAGFGTNALDVVAGAKMSMDSVGLDLRYTYDLVSNDTGFHTLRCGVYYEFGR